MKRWWLPAAIGSALLAVYALRLDEVAGLYVDDAYYIVLAQALARGQGYLLVSSAATPVLPAFPPGFPLLLAPVVAITDAFPANVVALKAVSIVAMLGVAMLTQWYWHRERGLDRSRAVVIAAITTLLPGFVFLATSTVMAECAFTLSLVAGAIAIERAARDTAGRSRAIVIAAVIASASMLIRSAGAALIVTGAIAVARTRGRKAAAMFIGTWLVCAAPWVWYAQVHAPTQAERDAHGGSIVYTYRELLSMRNGGDATSGSADVGDLLRRVSRNIFNVFGRDMGAVLLPAAYRGPSESGQEVFQLSGESGLLSGSMGLGTPVVVLSFLLSLVVLIGMLARRPAWGVAELLSLVTIAMVVIVPARTFRYVLPLAPFLVQFFLAGVEGIAKLWRGRAVSRPAYRIAAASLVILVLMEHGQYIAEKFEGPPPPWIADGREVQSVGDWINQHLPAGGGVASTNPALIYLMTGHKSVALVDPYRNWRRWKDIDIRYAVALHVASKPNPGLGYRSLYQSPRLGLWVVELDPRVRLTENASSP